MNKQFPKTKYLKFKELKRRGVVAYSVHDRYADVYTGIISNSHGYFRFISCTDTLSCNELYELARVCKWLEENEANNKNIKINKMDSFKCEGECKNDGTCFGEVKHVEVSGHGFKKPFRFHYCQEAREEDERRGFLVEEINEDLVKNEPDTQNIIPKNPA